MAEDKKPKIDLKARLGKKDANAGTSAPVPPPPMSGSIPPPRASGPVVTPGLTIPPGVPVGPPPALDPSNPLAAAMAPRPVASYAPPPQPQRIEIDETAVIEATKKSRNRGFVVAAIVGVLFAGVGFIGGQASQQGADRNKSSNDAHGPNGLKGDVDKAAAQMKDLAAKIEAGKALLTSDKPQFPDSLDTDLGAISIDFDGGKLAGRRFSGYSTDVSKQLFDFVVAVSTLNEQKTALKNLLVKLKGPLKAQLAANASGTHSIQQIVLLGGPNGKDPGGNTVGLLAPLSAPLTFTGDHPEIKEDFKAVFQRQNITVPRYKSGDLSAPSAVYVTPASFESVCPSEQKSQQAQLGFKLGDILTQIRGEAASADGMGPDAKPGLLELADKLSKALEKI